MTTVGMWLYPWDLLDHGAETVATELHDRGVDEVYVAASYHSVAAVLGNNPVRGFFGAPAAAVYFEPEPRWWEASDLRPTVADLVAEQGDALAAARDAFAAASIRLVGWTVCLHASALAATDPAVQVTSPLGRVPTLFCLNAPATSAYVRALAADVSGRVDALQLEALHWMAGPHAHHTKLGVPAPGLAQLLLSWCVCSHCLAVLADRGLDTARLGDDLDRLAIAALTGSGGPPMGVDIGDAVEFAAGVVRDLDGFLGARADAVLDLTKEVADASSVPIEIAPSGDPRITGVRPGPALDIVDRVHLLAYGGLDKVREVIDVVHADKLAPERVGLGLSVLAGEVQSKEEFEEEVELGVATGFGSIGLYNFGLMPRERLSWIEAVAQSADRRRKVQ